MCDKKLKQKKINSLYTLHFWPRLCPPPSNHTLNQSHVQYKARVYATT